MADNENNDWWKKYATKFKGTNGAQDGCSVTADTSKSAGPSNDGRVFRDEFDNEGTHMYHVEMTRVTHGVFTTSFDIAANSKADAMAAADYIQLDMSDCEFENVEKCESYTNVSSINEISAEMPK